MSCRCAPAAEQGRIQRGEHATRGTALASVMHACTTLMCVQQARRQSKAWRWRERRGWTWRERASPSEEPPRRQRRDKQARNGDAHKQIIGVGRAGVGWGERGKYEHKDSCLLDTSSLEQRRLPMRANRRRAGRRCSVPTTLPPRKCVSCTRWTQGSAGRGTQGGGWRPLATCSSAPPSRAPARTHSLTPQQALYRRESAAKTKTTGRTPTTSVASRGAGGAPLRHQHGLWRRRVV